MWSLYYNDITLTATQVTQVFLFQIHTKTRLKFRTAMKSMLSFNSYATDAMWTIKSITRVLQKKTFVLVMLQIKQRIYKQKTCFLVHGVGPLPVTPFVVIPRNKFYKVFIQRNSCLGVKYARPVEINSNRK